MNSVNDFKRSLNHSLDIQTFFKIRFKAICFPGNVNAWLYFSELTPLVRERERERERGREREMLSTTCTCNIVVFDHMG